MIAGADETLTGSQLPQSINNSGTTKRGINVYHTSQLQGLSGRNEHHVLQTVSGESSYFYLTIEERLSIAKLCSPVLGVVTSRMNRISGLKWNITCDSKEEDRHAQQLKNAYDLYREYADVSDMKYVVARAKSAQMLRQEMPDLKPDLTNFDKCLLRWSRRQQAVKTDKSEEISEWLQQPNEGDNFDEFIKKWVFDLLIHGACSIYKERLDGRVENFYTLPGGTVTPARSPFVGGGVVFVQITQGMENQVFYQDELCFSQYIPFSARSYGLVPLEALINKVSETLLYDRLMADQADGTKPPEKLILVTEDSPFGDLDNPAKIPMNPDEQKRLEEKVNTPIKNAVMTFSGNNAIVVDLSRENTMALQNTRQKDIREDVGLVFGATNMEMNLTGSDDTSGRSTSEEQRLILQAKGTAPICNTIQTKLNREIIPFRFGFGHRFEFDSSSDEAEQIDILTRKNQSGLYSVNEIRVKDLNEDPFEGEEFDKPQSAKPAEQGAGENNPLFTRSV